MFKIEGRSSDLLVCVDDVQLFLSLMALQKKAISDKLNADFVLIVLLFFRLFVGCCSPVCLNDRARFVFIRRSGGFAVFAY